MLPTPLLPLRHTFAALTLAGLKRFLAPSGDYLVRSLDPDGTVHGVLGQAVHGYYEASPNHDVRRLTGFAKRVGMGVVTGPSYMCAT